MHFAECERCDRLFASRTRTKRFCSDLCLRGRPEVHQCSDCEVIIPRSRFKCDDCVATTKRLRKREYKRRLAARRRAAKQIAYPPGGGLNGVAA